MVCDRNGNPLNPGDKVLIPATVFDIHPVAEPWNLELEVDLLAPGVKLRTWIRQLNGAQVEKCCETAVDVPRFPEAGRE